jgi:ornithine carbamoyltransferase
MKHFIAISDYSAEELRQILDVAKRLKKQYRDTGRNDPILAGKTLALVFEKPSLRTRVSFSVGMTHLGGVGMYLSKDEVGLGVREPVQDVARVLSGMCDGIQARVFEHAKIVGLAKYATVPVINGLSDYNHPCQAMADILTVEEHFGDLKGRTLSFIGDGNNVARSLAVACGKFGMKFILAAPAGYEFSRSEAEEILKLVPELKFTTLKDPIEAVKSADVVVTDTWVSMGQEAEKAKRIADFKGFQVDEKLLAHAPKHAVVLHCLPAYRGYEISEGVIEGPQSLVFPEAENRLHAQKGILAVLMGGM